MFRTEHPFTLPLGYVDEDGTLHREGMMRLATAADEIHPLRDPRVQQNEAYLIVIILSRVITSLGTVAQVNPKVIEGLYAADLAYLQELTWPICRSCTTRSTSSTRPAGKCRARTANTVSHWR
jgi:hypothetical protein